MSARDARTGEMRQFCEEWGKHAALFRGYSLTAPFVEIIADVHQQLKAADVAKRAALDAKQHDMLTAQMNAADAAHDDSARSLFGGVSWLIQADPKNAELYQRFLDVIFPDGLAVINTSVRNEAGIAANLEARIAGDTLLTSVLDITFGEHDLRYYFKNMIGAGTEAGVLAAELAVSEDVGAQLAGEYRARQRGISMVALMRRSAEFAGWSDADMQTVFGALDTQTAGRRAPRVAADVATPAPAPNPGI